MGRIKEKEGLAINCKFCGKRGHFESHCGTKFPDLRPKRSPSSGSRSQPRTPNSSNQILQGRNLPPTPKITTRKREKFSCCKPSPFRFRERSTTRKLRRLSTLVRPCQLSPLIWLTPGKFSDPQRYPSKLQMAKLFSHQGLQICCLTLVGNKFVNKRWCYQQMLFKRRCFDVP